MLTSLSRALGGDGQLRVERERVTGTSTITVVRGRTPAHGDVHWVVKQPHPEWSRHHDLDTILTAREELAALQRLERHFARPGIPCRVPATVALLPDLDAFVMEYVPGPSLREELTSASLLRPQRLLDQVTAAGALLRHLHDLEPPSYADVDLSSESEHVLALAERKLHPVGLDLPRDVRRTLCAVPPTPVRARRVPTHGAFTPANILFDAGGSTVTLDVTLRTGYPEDDLARFLAYAAGSAYLAAEMVVPRVVGTRREIEERLLGAYYRSSAPPVLFEIRYLYALCRRWLRLRELAQQRERHLGARPRSRVRLHLVDRQMRMLMSDSGRRLARGAGE